MLRTSAREAFDSQEDFPILETKVRNNDHFEHVDWTGLEQGGWRSSQIIEKPDKKVLTVMQVKVEFGVEENRTTSVKEALQKLKEK